MFERDGLWRKPDFMRVWAAQAISEMGSRFARDGLPLAAIIVLRANPGQVGLLGALSTAPRVLTGLTIGGFVDRSRRRRVMIAADIARAIILVSVPIAGWLHLLTVWQLYAVAFLVGAGSVIFDTANQAYFPTLVEEDQLLDGNTKLSVTASLANVAGPAAAGVLIQTLGAPIAVGVTAFSYLSSAGFLSTVKKKEELIEQRAQDRIRNDLIKSIREIYGHKIMRPMLLMDASASLFVAMFAALYPFIALGELHLSPGLFGLTFAIGGVGALLGAAARPWVTERVGFGPAAVIAAFVAGLASFTIPITHGSPLVATIVLSGAQFVGDGCSTVSGISVSTLRQSLFPKRKLGRIGSVFQVLSGGAAMTGGLLGGAAGLILGARGGMFIAATGLTMSILWGIISPLWSLKRLPISEHLEINS